MAKKMSTPDDLLGPIEHLVMRAVVALGPEKAYGMEIFDAIRENAYSAISFGSVYTSLERLTWKGYLEARIGEPESSRGGRARKYFSVTGVGKKVLEATQRAVNAPLTVGRPARA